MSAKTAAVLSTVLMLAAGCQGPTSPSRPVPGGPPPNLPGSEELAVFVVGDESFRVRLATPAMRAAAHEAYAGHTRLIPIGRVVDGTDLNRGWSWHIEDLSFAEATSETCDGRPSDVERGGGPRFGNGWYCPWGAEFVGILPIP